MRRATRCSFRPGPRRWVFNLAAERRRRPVAGHLDAGAMAATTPARRRGARRRRHGAADLRVGLRCRRGGHPLVRSGVPGRRRRPPVDPGRRHRHQRGHRRRPQPGLEARLGAPRLGRRIAAGHLLRPNVARWRIGPPGARWRPTRSNPTQRLADDLAAVYRSAGAGRRRSARRAEPNLAVAGRTAGRPGAARVDHPAGPPDVHAGPVRGSSHGPGRSRRRLGALRSGTPAGRAAAGPDGHRRSRRPRSRRRSAGPFRPQRDRGGAGSPGRVRGVARPAGGFDCRERLIEAAQASLGASRARNCSPSPEA